MLFLHFQCFLSFAVLLLPIIHFLYAIYLVLPNITIALMLLVTEEIENYTGKNLNKSYFQINLFYCVAMFMSMNIVFAVLFLQSANIGVMIELLPDFI